MLLSVVFCNGREKSARTGSGESFSSESIRGETNAKLHVLAERFSLDEPARKIEPIFSDRCRDLRVFVSGNGVEFYRKETGERMLDDRSLT